MKAFKILPLIFIAALTLASCICERPVASEYSIEKAFYVDETHILLYCGRNDWGKDNEYLDNIEITSSSKTHFIDRTKHVDVVYWIGKYENGTSFLAEVSPEFTAGELITVSGKDGKVTGSSTFVVPDTSNLIEEK